MGNVTIGVNTYPVYGDLPSAKIYIAGILGVGAAAWVALPTDDAKSQVLVTAQRYLDRQAWKGTAVNALGLPQWPRTGVTLPNGTAVDPSTVPVPVTNASYELCALLMADPTVNTALNSGSNLRLARAGTVEVEFFRPTFGTAGKLPPLITDLVGPYLGGQSSFGGVVSGTTDACGNPVQSAFTDDQQYTRWKDF